MSTSPIEGQLTGLERNISKREVRLGQVEFVLAGFCVRLALDRLRIDRPRNVEHLPRGVVIVLRLVRAFFGFAFALFAFVANGRGRRRASLGVLRLLDILSIIIECRLVSAKDELARRRGWRDVLVRYRQ